MLFNDYVVKEKQRGTHTHTHTHTHKHTHTHTNTHTHTSIWVLGLSLSPSSLPPLERSALPTTAYCTHSKQVSFLCFITLIANPGPKLRAIST